MPDCCSYRTIGPIFNLVESTKPKKRCVHVLLLISVASVCIGCAAVLELKGARLM